MKRIFKNPLFTFVLGAIIFGGIGTVVAATMLAKDVSYTPKNTSWNVNNVQDAIDDLYTKAKPEYTGSFEITPQENATVIPTKDKILTKNIRVNAIPGTYKNLTTTTTVNANNLLSGYKAYTSDGEVVTGTLSTECVNDSFISNNDITTANGQEVLNYIPKIFILRTTTKANNEMTFYYNKALSENTYNFIQKNSSGVTYTDSNISQRMVVGNKISLHDLTTNWVGITIYYTACK